MEPVTKRGIVRNITTASRAAVNTAHTAFSCLLSDGQKVMAVGIESAFFHPRNTQKVRPRALFVLLPQTGRRNVARLSYRTVTSHGPEAAIHPAGVRPGRAPDPPAHAPHRRRVGQAPRRPPSARTTGRVTSLISLDSTAIIQCIE